MADTHENLFVELESYLFHSSLNWTLQDLSQAHNKNGSLPRNIDEKVQIFFSTALSLYR